MEQQGIISAGLTPENLDFFFTLPDELQCIILSYNINLGVLITLLKSEYKDLVQDCVQHLVPEKGFTPQTQTISSDLVVSLPQLIKCGYPIKVDTYQQLVALLQHRNLRYAIFDITNLRSQEAYDDFLISPDAELVDDAYNLYNEYGSFWFIPIVIAYLPYEPCQPGCPNNPDYSYAFGTNPVSEWIIVRQNELNISPSKLARQLLPLFTKLTMCRYTGSYSPNLNPYLFAMPCLEHVVIRRLDITPESYIMLVRHGLRVSIRDIARFWRQITGPLNRSIYFRRLRDFFINGRGDANISSFMPVTLNYLDKVEDFFPNLTTISLLIDSNENIPWERLTQYNQIKLYRKKKSDVIDIPQAFVDRVVLR